MQRQNEFPCSPHQSPILKFSRFSKYLLNISINQEDWHLSDQRSGNIERNLFWLVNSHRPVSMAQGPLRRNTYGFPFNYDHTFILRKSPVVVYIQSWLTIDSRPDRVSHGSLIKSHAELRCRQPWANTKQGGCLHIFLNHHRGVPITLRVYHSEVLQFFKSTLYVILSEAAWENWAYWWLDLIHAETVKADERNLSEITNRVHWRPHICSWILKEIRYA